MPFLVKNETWLGGSETGCFSELALGLFQGRTPVFEEMAALGIMTDKSRVITLGGGVVNLDM